MPSEHKKYGMLINLDRCTGCYACQATCKSEYKIPFGTARCRVKTERSGSYPDMKKLFLPLLCNQCDNPPCIEACGDRLLSKNDDGVVLLESEGCTGCQLCQDSCPYNAIEINNETGRIEKCDFCYERISKGKPPVCVASCMGKAMLFGNINDPESSISKELKKSGLLALNPELNTAPLVFYRYKGETGHTALKEITSIKGINNNAAPTKKATSQTESDSRLKYTTDVMCPSECGISVVVEEGIAKKIYGNSHTLINNGTLCAKGAAGLELTYSPHRVKTPMLRTGKRGADKWKEISWDEAADYIARKLIAIKKKHGPESVFLDTGDVTDREAYYRLFHAFGTPNTYNHGSICDPNRKWGHWLMTGDERPLPDIQRPFLIRDRSEDKLNQKHDAKLIINIGANPFVATRFNYMSSGIPGAREEKGCIYVVVDPSHTNSAALSDSWIPIRPGTDAALLAAMLYYIISNDRKGEGDRNYIDHQFIDRYTTGWEDFRDSFLSYSAREDSSNSLFYFSSEWAEEKTGIPKDRIEELADLFGRTKPAAIEVGMHGTSHHTNGDVTSILMTALSLITGNMDRPGGIVFTSSTKPVKNEETSGTSFLKKTAIRNIDGNDVTGTVEELHKDHFGEYPAASKGVLSDLPKKIRNGIKLTHGPFNGHSYPVKAFITRAGNPVITAGNTADWIEGFTSKDKDNKYKLDLIVFIDSHITVTGTYADIVLPEAGFLERMGLSDVFTMSPEIALKDQVIKPLHQSKTSFEIMNLLADALIRNGDDDISSDDFNGRYKNEEAFIDELLSKAPGIYNVGKPLPYPEIPEGSLIVGTPDNPFAYDRDRVVREGELVTVEWLRKNHGVAVWPGSYYRYKNSGGHPSGTYPKTGSGKFEFRFGYLEDINNQLGTDLPVTFYWNDCKWNTQNPEYKELSQEYPFQLISGRVHHSMTMTSVCPSLSETDTECMKAMNDDFRYTMPGLKNIPNNYGLNESSETSFGAGSVSIPVFAINRSDGEKLKIKMGEIVDLENPMKKRITGKVYLTDEIMPGVIKTAFGQGGQRASGIGPLNQVSEYTPNINDLHDQDNISPFTGTPGFGDIIVKVIKKD